MIHIGSLSFPTKRAAEKHIREMFWRYPAMGALTGEDLKFALALIEMHPSRAVIVHCGIRSIHIQPVPFHEDQRRFLVWRTDESKHDFSWRNSLSPKTAKRELAGILRHLIEDQKKNFKLDHFRGVCETCGVKLRSARECHVDHAAPATFERLMAGWLKSLGLTADDIPIVKKTGYEEHSRLEDELLEREWAEYHQINARLRCVCRRCNLSVLRTSPKVSHAGEK